MPAAGRTLSTDQWHVTRGGSVVGSVVVVDVCMGGHTTLQYVSKCLDDTIICFGPKGEGKQ